jgi:hypothetical protein
MLAEGEHPRLRRRTMVIQQAVDARACAGMTIEFWCVTSARHASPVMTQKIPPATLH